MNLYITRFPKHVGHICAGANTTVTNADNQVVGYVTPEVADYLIRSGVAMDVTERDPEANAPDVRSKAHTLDHCWCGMPHRRDDFL